MVLGKKVTIFEWEWGRNSAPRDGQKKPCFHKSRPLDKSVIEKKKNSTKAYVVPSH